MERQGQCHNPHQLCDMSQGGFGRVWGWEKGVGNKPSGEVQEPCRFVLPCVAVQVTKWFCLGSSAEFVQTVRNEEVIPMGWIVCGSMKHSAGFS